jgi:adenylate cyclase
MRPAHRRMLRRAPAGAAAIAVVAGLLAWAIVASDFAHGARVQAADVVMPRGAASPQVLVVAFDRPFIRLGTSEGTGAFSAISGALLDAKTRTVVAEPDVVEAARHAFSEQYELDFLALAFRSGGRVLWALPNVDLGPPRPGSSLPMVRDAIAGSVLADAAVATGLDVIGPGADADAHTVAVAAEVPTGGQPSFRTTAVVPSAALVAWLRATRRAPDIRVGSDSVAVGGRKIPTENDGELRVHYVSALLPGGAQVISAVDLIEGRVPASRLRGKTVVVGVDDPSETTSVAAPVGPNRHLAPVYVEANAVNTLMTGAFLRVAPTSETVLTVVVLTSIVALLVLLLPLWACWAAPVLVAGAYWWFVRSRFGDGVVSDLAVPIAAIVFAFITAALGKAVIERRQRRHVTQLFSEYVPDSVARELIDSGIADTVAAGQRLDVTVIFCDLRGFTPISAALEPTQVRELLDCYYEAMTEIIQRREGTVLQFVGDEVYAVFGAPLPQRDHARMALDCAHEMLDVFPELDATLSQRGLPPVRYGIGVNTGPAVAAHVGTQVHRQYSVLGDTVNVGARLCNQAQAEELVFSDAVVAAVGRPPEAEEMGQLELKGVQRPVFGFRLRATANTTTAPPIDRHGTAPIAPTADEPDGHPRTTHVDL